jgi:hypothetical protein
MRYASHRPGSGWNVMDMLLVLLLVFRGYCRKELISSHLEARGVEPLFDDVHPGLSVNVLLEGIREQAERRGLLRMALDVITFVITSLFCCSTHFARNDIDSAWTNPTFQVRV